MANEVTPVCGRCLRWPCRCGAKGEVSAKTDEAREKLRLAYRAAVREHLAAIREFAAEGPAKSGRYRGSAEERRDFTSHKVLTVGKRLLALAARGVK